MFHLYSKGCEYAIRALIDIAAHGQESYVTVQQVCRRTRLPEPSTRKMLQLLSQKGFLRSIPGPHGGYQLLKAADRINVLDVIQVIDGRDALEGCVLDLPACNDKVPCALHATWKQTRRVLLPGLSRLTLQDIAQGVAARNKLRGVKR